MNSKYSYIDIAKEDLLAAKEMLRVKLYNHAARLCQQYMEKVLKECIARHGNQELDMLLLHTHKINRLAARCSELVGCSFNKEEVSFFRQLTDYYFDTNYPGENYIKISAVEAQQVYDDVLEFQKGYEEALASMATNPQLPHSE